MIIPKRYFRILSFVLTVLAGISHTYSQGSYRIMSQREQTFIFKSSDALHLTLQYNGQIPISAIVHAQVTNESGSRVAYLITESIQIQPGMNLLTPQNPGIRSKQYSSSHFQEIENSMGSLPQGKYKICYQLQCSQSDCGGLGTNYLATEQMQCIFITVGGYSPLLLAFPGHDERLSTLRPNFGWIAPMPLSTVAGFSYTWNLYTTRRKQTCEDASMRNRPIYQLSGLPQNITGYPVELESLDTTKTYCWQVLGMVGKQQIAQSEVWRLSFDPELKRADSIVIAKLQTANNAVHHCGDILAIAYVNPYGDLQLKGAFIDEKGNTLKSAVQLTARQGDNEYRLELQTIGVEIGKTYTLEVKDEIGKTYKLNFRRH